MACPFCSPAEADLYSDVQDSLAVVLVTKVDTRKYKVLKALKGSVRAGRVVIAAEPSGKNQPGSQLVLTTAGAPTLPYWSDPPRYLQPKELAFVKKALSLEGKPQTQQWDFAVTQLEDSSREIALSAYSLLAAAPLLEVQKRAPKAGNKRLMSWVKSGKIPEERRALYLLMAYPSLNSSELGWLESTLFGEALPKASPLLGPLVVAYLDLKGPSGVAKVKDHFLSEKLAATRTLGVIRALTLLGHTTESAPLRQAIRQVFLSELEHPQRGGFAIAPLAVWGVYEAAPAVERLAAKNSHVTWVKVSAIRFFRSFQGAEAEAALKRMAKSDPNLVSRTIDPYRKADLGIE